MTELTEPLDPAKVAQARAILWRLWRERAADLGLPEPTDLRGADAYAALIARELLGGEIRANREHVWVERDGEVIDLMAEGDAIREPAGYSRDEGFERSDWFRASLDASWPLVLHHLVGG